MRQLCFYLLLYPVWAIQCAVYLTCSVPLIVQMDLESVVDGLAQRQDQLAEAVTELTAAVQGMRAAKQLPVLGTLGITPWI